MLQVKYSRDIGISGIRMRRQQTKVNIVTSRNPLDYARSASHHPKQREKFWRLAIWHAKRRVTTAWCIFIALIAKHMYYVLYHI